MSDVLRQQFGQAEGVGVPAQQALNDDVPRVADALAELLARAVHNGAAAAVAGGAGDPSTPPLDVTIGGSFAVKVTAQLRHTLGHAPLAASQLGATSRVGDVDLFVNMGATAPPEHGAPMQPGTHQHAFATSMHDAVSGATQGRCYVDTTAHVHHRKRAEKMAGRTDCGLAVDGALAVVTLTVRRRSGPPGAPASPTDVELLKVQVISCRLNAVPVELRDSLGDCAAFNHHLLLGADNPHACCVSRDGVVEMRVGGVSPQPPALGVAAGECSPPPAHKGDLYPEVPAPGVVLKLAVAFAQPSRMGAETLHWHAVVAVAVVLYLVRMPIADFAARNNHEPVSTGASYCFKIMRHVYVRVRHRVSLLRSCQFGLRATAPTVGARAWSTGSPPPRAVRPPVVVNTARACQWVVRTWLREERGRTCPPPPVVRCVRNGAAHAGGISGAV